MELLKKSVCFLKSSLVSTCWDFFFWKSVQMVWSILLGGFMNEELPEFDLHQVNSFDTLNHCKPTIPFGRVYFCVKASISRPTWCWPCRGCPSWSTAWLALLKHLWKKRLWLKVDIICPGSKGSWTMVSCWLCATVEARLGESLAQCVGSGLGIREEKTRMRRWKLF